LLVCVCVVLFILIIMY